jgi:lipid-binding SYLF domain-containing protein
VKRALPGAVALLMLVLAMPAATAQGTSAGAGSGSSSHAQQAAVKHVGDAVGVAQRMGQEPGMAALLGRAQGIFIIPTYGRAALGVGGAGGAGVLVARRPGGSWGNPAFFDTGGLSIGLQAGVEAGPLVFLLMNEKAVGRFRSKNNFSLNADAGITVVNFARMAQGSTAGDVVAWSGARGLFGNAVTVGINDVRFNARLTDAYYGRTTTAEQAIDGSEVDAQAEALRKVLRSPPTPAGSSGAGGK